MFDKKLNQKDLEELRKRNELVKQHLLIAEALEIQKQLWFKNTLPKYGLDLDKKYNIDLRTGKIKQTKEKGKNHGFTGLGKPREIAN